MATLEVLTIGTVNWLCAVEVSTMFEMPERLYTYWPLERGNPAHWEEYIGKEVDYHSIYHEYSMYTPYGHSSRKHWRLPQGGDTLPIKTARAPYPCPKVPKNADTRYQYGKWQRLKTTKGAHTWVTL